jgi:hypothetical protein
MKTIGGTMVARILGLSRWGGPLSAYFELRGEPDTTPRNTAMDRGNVLEESVLLLWAEACGGQIIRPGKVHADALPHAHASLDAVGWLRAQKDAAGPILDGKTLMREALTDAWGADGTDRIPAEYQLQLLWYMMVAKAAGVNVADEALLPTLVGPEAELQWAARLVQRTGKPLALSDLDGTGLEFRIYRVAWDARLAEEVNARVLRFIREHVEPGIPPEPGDGDLTDRDVRAVARGHRAEKGRVVDFDALAPPEQAAIIEVVEASRQRKSWESAEEQARARVQVLMGGIEEVAGCPGGARVCWREMSSSGGRRFTIREPREK